MLFHVYLISALDHHVTRPGSPAPAAGEMLNPETPSGRRGQVQRLIRRRPLTTPALRRAANGHRRSTKSRPPGWRPGA